MKNRVIANHAMREKGRKTTKGKRDGVARPLEVETLIETAEPDGKPFILKCAPHVHCSGLQLAIDKGYLYVPLFMVSNPPGIKVNNAPAIPAIGGRHSRYGSLVLNFCPFCGVEFPEDDTP